MKRIEVVKPENVDKWLDGMGRETTTYVLWELVRGFGVAFELQPYGQYSAMNPIISVCTNLMYSTRDEVAINRFGVSRDGRETYHCAIWAESLHRFVQCIRYIANKIATEVSMPSGEAYDAHVAHVAKKAKGEIEGIYSITFTKFSQFSLIFIR